MSLYILAKFRNSSRAYSYKWNLDEEPSFDRLLIVDTASGYSVARLVKVVDKTDSKYEAVKEQATKGVVATFSDEEYQRILDENATN